MFTGSINISLLQLQNNNIDRIITITRPNGSSFGYSTQGLGIGDYTYSNNLFLCEDLNNLIDSVSIVLRGDNGASLYINGTYISYNHNGSYEGTIGGAPATYLTIPNPFNNGNNNITVIVHEESISSSTNWTSYSVEFIYHYRY